MPSPRLWCVLSLLPGLLACSPPEPPAATSTPPPPTPAPLPTATATASPIPSLTPMTCLSRPGRIENGALETTPPQEFLIYLPPCYDEKPDERYPTLYLLHGQTYTDEQWVRLGAAAAADNLVLSGQAAPFILVFPDDRYWNLPPGPGFGERLVSLLIPYIDRHYRTRADREHRALGGLSRGGGWAVHLLLTRYDLFGIIGLHSPAIFNEDTVMLARKLEAIPPEAWPRLWLDAGDQDKDLASIRAFEDLLSRLNLPHEWHLYNGDHSEAYWQRHLPAYLQWYVEGLARAANPAQPSSP